MESGIKSDTVVREIERRVWLEERRKGIGGSDAPSVMNVNPYRSALHVWADKTGALPLMDDGNRFTYWGKKLERSIAEGAAEANGWELIEPETMLVVPDDSTVSVRIQKPSISPRCSIQRANEDFRIRCPERGLGTLQVKNASFWMSKSWPEKYPRQDVTVQLQHEMECTQTDWGAVAVLVGGNDLKVYTLNRHEAFLSRLKIECESFWDLVLAGVEPPVHEIAHDSDASILQLLHPKAEPVTTEIDPTPEMRRNYGRLVELDAEIKRLTTEKNTIRNEFKQLTGDAEIAVFPPDTADGLAGYGFRYGEVNRNGKLTVTSERYEFIERIRELVEGYVGDDAEVKYSNPSTSRVLRRIGPLPKPPKLQAANRRED